jgi:tRNA(Ile)-lysidine synthase
MLDLKKIATICAAHNNKVWVAYSGGVDSHVLLHLARQQFNNLNAIHINDGLSPNAAKWQEHCEQQCIVLNIPLTTVTVDATAQPKQSPEDAARNARRAAWQKNLPKDAILLLAHHADDQAETILYRLCRGTGPTGLAGMQLESKLGHITLLRPLLECRKEDIIEYARLNNLNYVHDETNNELHFDRNFIRNIIIPQLKQRWPAVVANINRAGILSEQLVDCLQPEITKNLQQVIDLPGNNLNVLRWSKLSFAWQFETLRAWLQQHNISASLQHIQTIVNEVIGAAVDANPQFVIAEKQIRRFQGRLYVLDCDAANTPENFSVCWDLKSELQLPDNTKLQPAQISKDSNYLAELQQKNIIVKKGSHGAKAKKLFQQFGIPVWERHKYPLVFADGKLVAIVGLWS